MKFKLPHFLSRKIDSTDVLIKGKLLTCIILSVISAFIDIVFFSGLSKSGYPFLERIYQRPLYCRRCQ